MSNRRASGYRKAPVGLAGGRPGTRVPQRAAESIYHPDVEQSVGPPRCRGARDAEATVSQLGWYRLPAKAYRLRASLLHEVPGFMDRSPRRRVCGEAVQVALLEGVKPSPSSGRPSRRLWESLCTRVLSPAGA